MRTNRPSIQITANTIACACGKCGSAATIYPFPVETGTCFCSACSPAWIGSFLEWQLEQRRKELGTPNHTNYARNYAPRPSTRVWCGLGRAERSKPMETSLLLLNGLMSIFAMYGALIALKGMFLLAQWLNAKRHSR